VRHVEPEPAPEAAPAPARQPVSPPPVAAAPAEPTPIKEPRSSVADNVVVVDESTAKPASGRTGWWQRLTNG